MRVAARLKEDLAPLVDLVYPPRCPLCSEAMAAQDGVCADCWNGLVIPGEPCCSLCQRPFDSAELGEAAICAPCLEKPPRHDGIAAATLYNDASRKLVLSFKHGGRIALADMLGRLIAAKVPPSDQRYLVVPVPLHRWRLWRRGFNQSALLAKAIAKSIDAELALDGLVRHKSTPLLAGIGKAARKRILSGAIAVPAHARAMIKGRAILLVDDVLTSGATSEACVGALKRAGADEVIVACFSRVLNELSPDRVDQNETPGAQAPGAT
ncbi:double zinc ribbon domain-containing protein [Altererythrobacter sp. MF3-039]|uniref:double zinc ribbon domain-containing protein n=1 Tax=Altererythrobacter sp. MF3-039 TaxID=3252901 RepID=UPI00390C410F